VTRDWLIINECDGNHVWRTEGGRACPFHEAAAEKNLDSPCGHAGYASQAVYRCQACGEWDYGEEGGPGWEDCQGCMRRAA
jgi:hypothetical protein